MSGLYGYVPNVVQQQNQPKPVAADPVVPKRAEITPETAPSTARKVAPAFEANAASQSNVGADQNPDKSRQTALIAAETDTASRLAAESKVAASDISERQTPADLADQKAQDLAKAREHASEYRAYKARLESAQTSEMPVTGEDGEIKQKMDVRIPFPDEMPDRPLPRFGVQSV